jgi:antitoxin component of RelBE/YafQ-DinJ toxin-antitoxin module
MKSGFIEGDEKRLRRDIPRVQIQPERFERFKSLCEKHNVSMSQVVRRCVNRILEEGVIPF